LLFPEQSLQQVPAAQLLPAGFEQVLLPVLLCFFLHEQPLVRILQPEQQPKQLKSKAKASSSLITHA
jgi:hypothetical protein